MSRSANEVIPSSSTAKSIATSLGLGIARVVTRAPGGIGKRLDVEFVIVIEFEGMEAIDQAQRDEHLAEAQRRLPGPAYYQVLRWIHEALVPTNYVEIGIRRGTSLRMALPGT